jgi:hypothetical protein
LHYSIASRLKMARYIFQWSFYFDAATSPLALRLFVKFGCADVVVMTSILQILFQRKAGLLPAENNNSDDIFLRKMSHRALVKMALSSIL